MKTFWASVNNSLNKYNFGYYCSHRGGPWSSPLKRLKTLSHQHGIKSWLANFYANFTMFCQWKSHTYQYTPRESIACMLAGLSWAKQFTILLFCNCLIPKSRQTFPTETTFKTFIKLSTSLELLWGSQSIKQNWISNKKPLERNIFHKYKFWSIKQLFKDNPDGKIK